MLAKQTEEKPHLGSEEWGAFPGWLVWVEGWILRVSMAAGAPKCLQVVGSPQKSAAGEGTYAAQEAWTRAINHMLQCLCLVGTRLDCTLDSWNTHG